MNSALGVEDEYSFIFARDNRVECENETGGRGLGPRGVTSPGVLEPSFVPLFRRRVVKKSPNNERARVCSAWSLVIYSDGERRAQGTGM